MKMIKRKDAELRAIQYEIDFLKTEPRNFDIEKRISRLEEEKKEYNGENERLRRKYARKTN